MAFKVLVNQHFVIILLQIRILLLGLLALADCRKHLTLPANVTRLHAERINLLLASP